MDKIEDMPVLLITTGVLALFHLDVISNQRFDLSTESRWTVYIYLN